MCGSNRFCKPQNRPENIPKIDLSNLACFNKRRIEDIGKDLTPIPNTIETNNMDTDSEDGILIGDYRYEKKKSPFAIVSKRSAHCSKKKIIPMKIQMHKASKINSIKNKEHRSYKIKQCDKGIKTNRESIINRFDNASPTPEIQCKVYKPFKLSYKSDYNSREVSQQSHQRSESYFSVIQKKYCNKFKTEFTELKSNRISSVEKSSYSNNSFSTK